MSPFRKLSPGGYRLRLVVGFMTLLALVTGLFLRADDVSPEAHYAYMQSLRSVQQADTELNAAVLASYADLLHNYDPLVIQLGKIRDERRRMQHVPPSLSAEARERLQNQVSRLLAAQQEKEHDIDFFKRSNSVLRNSELYFPKAAEAFIDEQTGQDTRPFDAFVRHVLSFMRGSDVEAAENLRREVSAMRQHPWETNGALSINQLLVHAEVIIERRPEVNVLAQRIMQAPTGRLLDEVTRSYVEGHEQALQRASNYRRLLYLVSLMLVVYAIYALFRIERDRRALATAHRNLEERYEAQRRAEEQLRLYATVFTSASEGMTITDEIGRAHV